MISHINFHLPRNLILHADRWTTMAKKLTTVPKMMKTTFQWRTTSLNKAIAIFSKAQTWFNFFEHLLSVLRSENPLEFRSTLPQGKLYCYLFSGSWIKTGKTPLSHTNWIQYHIKRRIVERHTRRNKKKKFQHKFLM